MKKLLKSKLLITAIFERLCIEKKVRQIFSVFSTCSFLFLMCEIDPGCKQMLFLEHAQSDEWDSLLVKKLLVTKRHMRSGSGALSTWGTNLLVWYEVGLICVYSSTKNKEALVRRFTTSARLKQNLMNARLDKKSE